MSFTKFYLEILVKWKYFFQIYFIFFIDAWSERWILDYNPILSFFNHVQPSKIEFNNWSLTILILFRNSSSIWSKKSSVCLHEDLVKMSLFLRINLIALITKAMTIFALACDLEDISFCAVVRLWLSLWDISPGRSSKNKPFFNYTLCCISSLGFFLCSTSILSTTLCLIFGLNKLSYRVQCLYKDKFKYVNFSWTSFCFWVL